MIHFVVALRAEARPLIDRYRLERRSDGAFTTYVAEGKRLVVSGIGKDAAAAATARAHYESEESSGVWLNVGIAGHRDRSTGELVRAHRITDASTGKRFYPTLLGLEQIDSAGVTTVDAAETSFASNDVFDMEASGFYETALSLSTAELVQCVKIVSDNRETGIGVLTAELVEGLIERNLDTIDAMATHLESVSAALGPTRIRPDVTPFVETWHFTTSERRRLHRLLERCHAFGAPPRPDELDEIHRLESASAVLSALDERLRCLAAEQSEF